MTALIENRDPLAAVQIHDGAVFVARRVEGAQQFKMAALIGAGALHDAIPGTAHFFEHLPFNVSANFRDGEIFQYFKRHGGDVSAFTGYDVTTYHGEVQKENYREGIKGIAELVCKPVFEPRRIADEAKTILTEWAMRMGWQDRQRYRRNVRAVLGDSAPHDVLGSPDSIQSISINDLHAFYLQHYTSDNLVVYMQGDLEPARLLEEAIGQFSLPRGVRTEPRPVYKFQPSTVRIDIPDSLATHATILFPALRADAEPPIRQAAIMCGRMLCSAEGGIIKEARFDRRLVYTIEIIGDFGFSWGFDGIVFDAFPEKVPEVCEIIMRNTALLASDPDQSFFESIKRKREIDVSDYLRINREKKPHEEVFWIWASGIVQPHDAHLKALSDVTLENVARYAQEYLNGGQVSVVYEGKVQEKFPCHDDLIQFQKNAAPARTQEMDGRLTAKPSSGNPRGPSQ